jgi:hypothetical protein
VVPTQIAQFGEVTFSWNVAETQICL